jgi:hypothetical protein
MKKKKPIPAVVPIVRAACLVGPNGMPCDGGEISAKKQSGVSGTVMFEDDGNECKITYTVSGLTPGMHGFHIHEKADFSKGCISAGPHYNPHKVTHGGQGEQYVAILLTKCRFMFNYSTRLFFCQMMMRNAATSATWVTLQQMKTVSPRAPSQINLSSCE